MELRNSYLLHHLQTLVLLWIATRGGHVSAGLVAKCYFILQPTGVFYPFAIHAISVETIFIGCKLMGLVTGDNIYLEQTNSERR